MNDDILRILAEAGSKGLRLQKLVLHVYNASNSLFHPVELEEVRRRVLSFVKKNSHRGGLIQRTKWGVYRLNSHSAQAQEIMLTFNEYDADSVDSADNSQKNPQTSADVQGPSLFD